VRFQIDIDADQINGRPQVIRAIVARAVDFHNLGHARPAGGNGAGHDVDQFVGQDRREPGYRCLFDMEFERLAPRHFPKLGFAPIFGDRDIGIIQIAGVEDDALRVGL